jgi:hypothetical protein
MEACLSCIRSIQKTMVLFFGSHSFAEVAQLVEHFPEEEGVAGSSPALSTQKIEKTKTRRLRLRVFVFNTN